MNFVQIQPVFVTLNLFQGPSCRRLGAMNDKLPCVYILASQPNGTVYIGVTSDLVGRLWQHRNNALPGFTARHDAHMLVHYELFGGMEPAILRKAAQTLAPGVEDQPH
jgi:putative endonuclease